MLKRKEFRREMRLHRATHARFTGEATKQRLRGGIVIGDGGSHPGTASIRGQFQPCAEHPQPQSRATTFGENTNLPHEGCVRLAGGAVAHHSPYDFALGFGYEAGIREVGRKQQVAIRRVGFETTRSFYQLPECGAVGGLGCAKSDRCCAVYAVPVWIWHAEIFAGGRSFACRYSEHPTWPTNWYLSNLYKCNYYRVKLSRQPLVII